MRTIIQNDQRLAGQMAIFATALLMSTNGLFIRLLPWHPMVIAGMRSIIAAVFLLVFRMIFPPPKGVKNPPIPLWICGFLFAGTMITFVIANTITTAANVILLQYGAPVWAALLGWLLIKEKPHWEQWGALVLVIIGLLIFLRDGLGTGALLGDGIAVFSGLLFGANSVMLRKLKNGNPSDAMLLAHVICAVIGAPFIFLHPPALSMAPVLTILYMGIVSIGFGAFLFAYGIKRIPAIQAMLITVFEPLLNPVWVLLITGERPAPAAIVGGAMILAAVIASSVIGKRREERLRTQ